jgi:beta-ureidopropionase / N-carbamoyl-L-amino-acid hydrolase
MGMERPSIDANRLWASLMELAEVGAYHDETCGLVGVNRLALTEADAAGRRLVKRWFEEAGLSVRVDRIGNTIGRRAGKDSALAPVVAGSHIDSVPTGGAFDGALGVLGALEVVRTLNDLGIETTRPIEIGFFTDEEGARFGTDMLGSAVACGRLTLDHAYALSDKNGLTVRGELEKIGFLGDAETRFSPPFAYVEVHVEQGPILAARGMELGVVTGVQGISWQEITITGKSAHAGTTPMELRKDAGLAAAKLNVHLHEMVASGRYGKDMRATMGRVEPMPNRVNIVPSRVVCTIDLRNPDDAAMERTERDLDAYLRTLERELKVSIEARQTAKTRRIPFSPKVQSLIASKIQARGHVFQEILSGAGHDAQEFAAICPTAMIFVPGEYEGISHNPREYSTPEACARGVNILLDTISDLAEAQEIGP